jgi:hypothetical protein
MKVMKPTRTKVNGAWNGSSIAEFPRLNMQELLRFTLGIYQIKRSAWYVKQHMSESGQFEFFMHRQEDQLIRIKMQSRHRSGKQYNVWVKFDGAKMGLDGILGYLCDCPVGLRVVGACSHVTSVSLYQHRNLMFGLKLTFSCLRL